MNPAKGRKLFPRLLRHLPHQQALTLLTLLIATYPQLDVVARAPPPPVADASLLTKADGLNRVRREAETDDFLHCVIPGADMLINRCNLGLLAGLLGICAQRMEVWKVASTRVCCLSSFGLTNANELSAGCGIVHSAIVQSPRSYSSPCARPNEPTKIPSS